MGISTQKVSQLSPLTPMEPRLSIPSMLAIMIFDEQYTSLTIIGLGLTVMGMGSYSYFAWNESSLEQTVELEEFKDESDEVLSVQSHHRQA